MKKKHEMEEMTWKKKSKPIRGRAEQTPGWTTFSNLAFRRAYLPKNAHASLKPLKTMQAALDNIVFYFSQEKVDLRNFCQQNMLFDYRVKKKDPGKRKRRVMVVLEKKKRTASSTTLTPIATKTKKITLNLELCSRRRNRKVKLRPSIIF